MSILTFVSKVRLFYISSILHIAEFCTLQMILAQTQLDDDVRGLLEKISQVYDFMNKDGRLADVPSMQILCEKMAQQILECADFVTHYSDIRSACESNRLHRRLILHVISLHREKTCQKHLERNEDHDSEIQQCSRHSHAAISRSCGS